MLERQLAARASRPNGRRSRCRHRSGRASRRRVCASSPAPARAVARRVARSMPTGGRRSSAEAEYSVRPSGLNEIWPADVVPGAQIPEERRVGVERGLERAGGRRPGSRRAASSASSIAMSRFVPVRLCDSETRRATSAAEPGVRRSPFVVRVVPLHERDRAGDERDHEREGGRDEPAPQPAPGVRDRVLARACPPRRGSRRRTPVRASVNWSPRASSSSTAASRRPPR